MVSEEPAAFARSHVARFHVADLNGGTDYFFQETFRMPGRKELAVERMIVLRERVTIVEDTRKHRVSALHAEAETHA